MVLAALGEAVWGELVVGSVQYAIDGAVVCALDDARYGAGCTSTGGVE